MFTEENTTSIHRGSGMNVPGRSVHYSAGKGGWRQPAGLVAIGGIVVTVALAVILMSFLTRAGGVGTGAAAVGLGSRTVATCEVPHFDATVRVGPDTGLALRGALFLQTDASGHLTSLLQRPGSSPLRGSGQVVGQAINLYFHLGPGRDVFGTGTLDHDFRACSGNLGGTFAGPAHADIGNWACSCCPCYIRTISPNLGMRIDIPRLAIGVLDMHGHLVRIAVGSGPGHGARTSA